MKVGRHEVGNNPPELIGYLLGKAIAPDSEDEDRLLVLKAANRIDSKNGSNYGRVVLNKLKRSSGKNRGENSGDIRRINRMFSSSFDLADTVREVASALGESALPKIVIADVRQKESGNFTIWDPFNMAAAIEVEPFDGVVEPSGQLRTLEDLGNPEFIVSTEGTKNEINRFTNAITAVIQEHTR